MEAFLELLSFCLCNTSVGFKDEVFVQRSGVCIGSRIALGPSSIFFSKVDRDLEVHLQDITIRIFCYVTDFLVLTRSIRLESFVNEVLQAFSYGGGGLNFSCEMPVNTTLQFLHLSLHFLSQRVCLMYAPRSAEPLLSYHSFYSKLVKNGMAFSCLKSAVYRSCTHFLLHSFQEQVYRLKNVAFPVSVIRTTCLSLVKQIKGIDASSQNTAHNDKIAVTPYVHALSHRLFSRKWPSGLAMFNDRQQALQGRDARLLH